SSSFRRLEEPVFLERNAPFAWREGKAARSVVLFEPQAVHSMTVVVGTPANWPSRKCTSAWAVVNVTLLGMNTIARERYPSDLTDLQWCNIEHLFPQGTGKTGRPRTYPLREIVNAVLYLARGGCTWRMLPHDFPPWKTVSYYFYTWRDQGVWERVHAA